MPMYETQARPWNGPGLSPLERKLATYLQLVVVNARRRSANEFDVEIDYIVPEQECTTGWMPLVLLHEQWKRRPREIGELVEAAGGRSAADCEDDWDYVLELDDHEKLMSICHGIWALACARG